MAEDSGSAAEYDGWFSALLRCPVDDYEWSVDGYFYTDADDQPLVDEEGIYLVNMGKSGAFRPVSNEELRCELCGCFGEVESSP